MSESGYWSVEIPVRLTLTVGVPHSLPGLHSGCEGQKAEEEKGKR